MNDPSGIRICSAQIASIWENPEKTLDKAELFIRHAALSGASLICFPEQFATGWDPESDHHLEHINGRIVSVLRGFARDNSIGILGSFREKGSTLPKNTAVAIGRDGRILATYAKTHLFSPGKEQDSYQPGTDLGIFTIGTLVCGIAICYDLRFPDLFRIYAEKGVHAVIVPAAWPSKRVLQWELFITARAAENQMYVAGINTTGETPVDMYPGSSMTADPQGTIISRAGDAEQMLFSDIDPSVVERDRRVFPVHKDRKDLLYTMLSRK
jgi:omega-amidase